MYPRKLLTLLVASLALAFSGCHRADDLREIDLEDTVELTESKPLHRPEINICVGSMTTPEQGYAYYKKLLDYIGVKLGFKVNFIEKKTYAEVNALLKNGGIDMAFVCGGPYVEGREEFGLELLAAPMVDGKVVYYSYIIVPKHSGIQRLEELEGKKFAFADPMSNSGRLVPTYMLFELGSDPEHFFGEYVYTYDHDKSIKAVARGIVDGAAVDSLIWRYLDKKGHGFTRDTRIIKVSEPYGIPPVVVRPGLPVDLKSKLKDALLSMGGDPEGSAILKEMLIDKFVEVDDSNYDSIRRIKLLVGR